MWFVELNGTIDGRVVNGNNVGRITMRGEITEFDDSEPDGLADERRGRPRSQRLVHERRRAGPRNARRRDHGVSACRQRRAASGSRPAAIASRRCGFANRLWYADGNGNKISYLHFE